MENNLTKTRYLTESRGPIVPLEQQPAHALTVNPTKIKFDGLSPGYLTFIAKYLPFTYLLTHSLTHLLTLTLSHSFTHPLTLSLIFFLAEYCIL